LDSRPSKRFTLAGKKFGVNVAPSTLFLSLSLSLSFPRFYAGTDVPSLFVYNCFFFSFFRTVLISLHSRECSPRVAAIYF